jgi:hypothetical protein
LLEITAITNQTHGQKLMDKAKFTSVEGGVCVSVRDFSTKIFVTLLDYLKIPQVTILGDLYV